MNRPKIDNINQMSDCDLKNVIYQLEEYCDELEDRCDILKEYVRILRKNSQTLAKAFGKVCEVLSIVSKDYCIGRLCFKSCDIDCGECPTQEELKRHYIKEVQDE